MKINKILAVGLVGALALSVGGVCQPLDKALAQTSKEDRSALLPPQNQAAPTSPEDLKKEQKNAKKQLSKLKNLSTKEKGEYKSRIDKASNKKEIDEIIKEAQTKNEEILKTTKEETKKEIENDNDLDSNERGILLEKIQKAQTKSEVQSIKGFPLQIAKELSKATNLSKDQKDSLREYNGKHPEEQFKKVQELNQKVGQAKKEIQDLQNIDENKKQDYKNQIDNTIENDKIDEIVQKAKAEKGKDDKEEAKEAEGLVQKAEDAYKKAKEEIDNAGQVISQEKLNELTNKVEEAKKEKEKAKEAVEKLPDSVKDKKDSLNQRITKLTEPALPAVNDTNNNGKDDKEEAKEAEGLVQKADKKINSNKEAKQNPAKLASTGLSTQSSTFIATILAMIAIFLRRRNK